MGDEQAWKRLGQLLVAARVGQGFTRRAAFARHHGLTHDRTLADIELGRKHSYDVSTLAHVEQMYGWRAGSIKAVLAGGEPVQVVGPGSDSPAFVATGSGGPRDLSDLTLEQLADEARRLNDEMVRRLRDGA